VMAASTSSREETGSLRKRIETAAAALPASDAARVIRVADQLAEYLAVLRAENQKMSLVSTRAAEPEKLVNRHLGDSLLGLPLLPPPSSSASLRLLDIGSGGGFPAIPLLIVRRDLEGTLVESTRKKCAFLAKLVARFSLTATLVNARFPESFPMNRPVRYDILTTRAVASAGRLVRAARPFLAPSARVLLWTTEPLFLETVRHSGARRSAFHPTPGAERRGIAILESFT
jgi:16S rRNA (guanine(527)-N(7))-methyltransferase RsmG